MVVRAHRAEELQLEPLERPRLAQVVEVELVEEPAVPNLQAGRQPEDVLRNSGGREEPDVLGRDARLDAKYAWLPARPGGLSAVPVEVPGLRKVGLGRRMPEVGNSPSAGREFPLDLARRPLEVRRLLRIVGDELEPESRDRRGTTRRTGAVAVRDPRDAVALRRLLPPLAHASDFREDLGVMPIEGEVGCRAIEDARQEVVREQLRDGTTRPIRRALLSSLESPRVHRNTGGGDAAGSLGGDQACRFSFSSRSAWVSRRIGAQRGSRIAGERSYGYV